MSERGAFTTAYIYCKEDRQVIHDYFANGEWRNVSLSVVTAAGGPIVAGVVRCSPGWPGQEIFEMSQAVLPKLPEVINREIVVVVAADNGDIAELTACPQHNRVYLWQRGDRATW
jgi:hypothetical protein